eukprot:2142761-Pyramimonas_sp.AAC.1
MRSTAMVEHGSDQRKKENGWTVESIGQSALEQNKRAFQQATFPDRWGSNRQHEFCQSVYKNMSRHKPDINGSRQTFRQYFEQFAMENI